MNKIKRGEHVNVSFSSKQIITSNIQFETVILVSILLYYGMLSVKELTRRKTKNYNLIAAFTVLTFASFLLDSLYDRVEVPEASREHVTTVSCHLI